jgi:hypothetical protein
VSDLSTNTRRYPRTLNEAFPNTVENGQAIYGPYKAHRIEWPLRACAAAFVLVLLMGVA